MDSCQMAGLARDSYLYNSRGWLFSHDWWDFSDAWSDVYIFTSDFSPHDDPDSYLLQKRWNTTLELGLAEEEINTYYGIPNSWRLIASHPRIMTQRTPGTG